MEHERFMVRRDCYLCRGERFLRVDADHNYPCPLCEMTGVILVWPDEVPPVPGRLLRTILTVLAKELGLSADELYEANDLPPGEVE